MRCQHAFSILLIVSLVFSSGCASKVAVPAAGMAVITPAVALKVLSDITSTKKYNKGYVDGTSIALSEAPAETFVVVYRTTESGRYKDGLYHGWFDTMFLVAIKHFDVASPD